MGSAEIMENMGRSAGTGRGVIAGNGTGTGRLRMLCLLLCLVCLVVMSASTVSAASYQAKIGKKKYKTVQKAVKAVKKGQTIKLLKNITLKKNTAIKLNRNVKYVLDMNGKTISRMESGKNATNSKYDKSIVPCLRVTKGTVTIKNGKVKALKKHGSAIVVSGSARVNLKGGVYFNEQIIVRGKGELTTNGVSFRNDYYPCIVQFGGKITIDNGTFLSKGSCLLLCGGTTVLTGGDLTSTGKGAAIDLSGSANLTINDCIVKAAATCIRAGTPAKSVIKIRKGALTAGTGNAVFLAGTRAKLTISGGTYTADTSPALYTKSATGISDGTFTAGDSNAVNDRSGGNMTISGGTYKNASASYPTIYSDTRIKLKREVVVTNSKDSSKTIENAADYKDQDN